ncbi:hypothetical protein AYO20_11579 [Fonsecaea nubica]|uniref:Uncharacterized protein n=1 Tax=Fonsecaea nubica TaxID=856822 RepID=A0A178BS67_9EURO|nr:hypothetical protein AYO20_11579 [Fonsecaea nubica]OAL19725.1 hypothetical protein AYO20_11579 [Fonsecaea nubica]
MAEHLALWQKFYDTDAKGRPVNAEFLGRFGAEPVRLVFCKDEPSADEIALAPDGATSIYFTRQTLNWDGHLDFDKRVIVFGTREYRRCGSRISQPWSEEMKPEQSCLPIDLAVLHDPAIYLHAAATLFTDVTEHQLEAIKRDMKSPPPQYGPVSEQQEDPTPLTLTPPNTPAFEDLFMQSLSLQDSAVPLAARAEAVKLRMVTKKRARRQRSRVPHPRKATLRLAKRRLALSGRGVLGATSLVRGGRTFTVQESGRCTEEL